MKSLLALSSAHPALQAVGVASLIALALSLAGVFLDPRVITGAPTGAQPAEIATLGGPTTRGAHTVGAPDGGRGLPVTGWSLEAGDLRVSHYLGMHGMQALPLLAVLLSRRRPALAESKRRACVTLAAASYAVLTLLFWQAIRGQSVAAPGTPTLIALGLWLLASALAARRVLASPAMTTISSPDTSASHA
ncbi:MAG: hypothetical protein ACREOF_11885 [Gemmatimonadales bacterium]